MCEGNYISKAWIFYELKDPYSTFVEETSFHEKESKPALSAGTMPDLVVTSAEAADTHFWTWNQQLVPELLSPFSATFGFINLQESFDSRVTNQYYYSIKSPEWATEDQWC